LSQTKGFFSETFASGQKNNVIVEHTQHKVSHTNGASMLGWLMAFPVVDEYRLFVPGSKRTF
jgi:hypothetical protein